jgi:hypothetical protein
MYKNKILILSILIILLLCGCATIPCPVFTKDGKEYGKVKNFHGDWDDYYQCGLSYIEGEFYPYAIWALDQAIAQRYGDQRKARTYGLHFIDDYFPHREKGLVHYLTGDYDKALSELELSLKQEKSEKAYRIRDKVLIKLIKKEIASKPAVSISDIFQESYLFHKESEDSYLIWTKNDPVVISGIATDEQYISEIILREKQLFQDGKPIFLEHSDQEIRFREDLKLHQGKFDLKITARNLRGGERTIHLAIHVDRSGPMITLTGYKEECQSSTLAPECQNSILAIQGWLYDESGIGELIANEKIISVPQKTEAFFTIPLTLPEIKIIAIDKLGNQTETVFHMDRLAYSHSAPILLAQHSESTQLTDSQSQTQASYLPEINLKKLCDNLCERETVFSERVSIQGEIKSKTKLIGFSVNDIAVLHRSGTDVVFNYSADLVPGENIIRIRAINESGIAMKKIVVIRKIPEIYKIEYRYRLATYPFLYTSDLSKNLLSFDMFLKGFTDRNRFQIYIREHTEEILDSSAPSCHATLVGVVNESINGVEIVSRMVDIQNGEVLAIEDSYTEKKDKASLDMMTERLIEKIHRAFPIIKGVITDISWFFKHIKVDSPEKVRKNFPLMVYQDDIPETEIIAYECINNGTCKKILNHRKPQKGDKVIMH